MKIYVIAETSDLISDLQEFGGYSRLSDAQNTNKELTELHGNKPYKIYKLTIKKERVK